MIVIPSTDLGTILKVSWESAIFTGWTPGCRVSLVYGTEPIGYTVPLWYCHNRTCRLSWHCDDVSI